MAWLTNVCILPNSGPTKKKGRIHHSSKIPQNHFKVSTRPVQVKIGGKMVEQNCKIWTWKFENEWQKLSNQKLYWFGVGAGVEP